jgi:type I restriction enzyme, R subunit
MNQTPRNEAQTRRDLIDPAIFDRGWTNNLIKVEITPGGTDIINGKPVRRRGRSDYLLCLPAPRNGVPLPVAILEAKKEGTHASLGLQQALNYAKRFNVSFAYSSNGELFCEYAEDTKQISDPKPLAEFPTPNELYKRFEQIRQLDLEANETQALFAKYKGGESFRYYFQDASIRAVFEKLANGEKRALLSLATGTGKTYVAKQLLYKLFQAGQLRKALFLVDRDELRTQAITHMQSVFGDDAREVTTSNPNLNARVLIATYQTLNVGDEDNKPQFWKDNFPPNIFSHIIIDECHRSAWSKWSVVLTDNTDAVQIGLTATPRRFKKMDDSDDGKITAHNIQYFGEPVYDYTISQGQDDGYLAACEIFHRFVDLDLQP